MHRASDSLEIGGYVERTIYVAFIVITELIIFFTEDATVLLIWWQTGTYDNNNAFARANLYITVASGVVCTASFLYTVGRMWREFWKVDRDAFFTYLLPWRMCTERGSFADGDGFFFTAWSHFLFVHLPWLLVGAMGFWIWVALVYIDKGTWPPCATVHSHAHCGFRQQHVPAHMCTRALTGCCRCAQGCGQGTTSRDA